MAESEEPESEQSELGDDLPAGLRIAVWDADEIAYRANLEESVRQARMRLIRYTSMGDTPPSLNVTIYLIGLVFTLGAAATLSVAWYSLSRPSLVLAGTTLMAGVFLLVWMSTRRARIVRLLQSIRGDAAALLTDAENGRARENVLLLASVAEQLRFAHQWTVAEHVTSAQIEIKKRHG